MSEGEKVETTTQSMPREEKKKDTPKDVRSKNPWHKTTPSPTDDGGQFGDKLTDLDQHHYQTDFKMAEGPAPPADYYEIKDIPSTSEELMGQEYRERIVMHTKNIEGTQSAGQQSNTKKKYNDEEGYKHRLHPDKHHYDVPGDIFPPPRAEAREHHSTTPQQMISAHESAFEKSKNLNAFKATTEDPFRVTHPYSGKYQTASQKLKEAGEQRWKTGAEKVKPDEKKVEVGATFFFKDEVTTTKKPRLQVPPTTEAPVTHSSSQERDIPKHTLAQQHLSKIMNDFFAMSSSSTPGRVHLDTTKEEEDLIVPEYRIPDEDIYSGAESVTDDAEEIPPELLEVVDLLTGHVGNEKSDLKPRTSHEIIKIDGPITESHIEKIFLDDKFEEEDSDRHESVDEAFKKFVVVPQSQEEKEIRDIAEVAELTSLKLEPLLKQISDEKSVRVIPLKAEPIRKRQPTLLTAKQIPVRVIYRDQLTEAVRSTLSTRKPNVKLVQTRLAAPHYKFISGRKRTLPSPLSHSYSHTRTSIILHPPTLFPPHPPPLPRKHLPFKIGYPFVTNSRSRLQTSQIHRRRKRSIMSRLRRQIRQGQNFLPFSTPVYPAFNPKFAPTFSPFKALFNPVSLHSSGTHLNPFVYPGFPIAKPSQNRPNIFQSSHPRPPPVRHVTHSGHQAVIVEEVPVPIHVEVPNPNLIRPGTHPSKLNHRYPGNQFRAPSPPALQTPPLLQRPQNRYPPPPRPPPSQSSNNYQPLGMPSNARPPPPMNYRSPIPLTGPLPPSITSDGQVYALGVTNKPLIPENSRPARPPNGGPKPPRNPPRPYNPFSVHASAYPNFPYFQGAFTTPISNEPVIGRIMYSGYKPPKSTSGTKPPKSSTRSNKDRKTSESKSNRSRSKSTAEYFDAPAKPLRESHVSYTQEVLPRGRSRPKQNLDNYSVDYTDLKPPKQNLSKNTGSSDEYVPRKRRPGRRRRPRPHSTTQGTPILNDISPTPPPPQQIPPPPADFSSKPSQHETLSSLPSFSTGTKVPETSSHFPPAGYYGKDQLVQFFDSSSKSYQKTTSPKPYQHRDFGESTSSAELDESVTSTSGEDGEPAFGTRLRSKPRSQSRNRQSKNNQPAQTQKAEIRTRPNNRPDETPEHKRKEFRKPNENNKAPIRNDRPPPPPPPPRRRRPPPQRPRSRPPPMQAPQPEVHHFKYNENVGNFYSVPRGLQNLVAPSAHPPPPPQGFRGGGSSTDMFGIPHPVIDQSIYSLRPQGAPDFDPNFFSVPAHVAQQQQQSPLHNMNIKPIPESARNFFTAPEPGSSPEPPEANAPEKKESEQSSSSNKSGGESSEQRDPPVRKLRKPKRKNRYNPHSSEQRDSTESISVKPHTEQMAARDSSTVRYREKSTTVATTTAEPRSTVSNYHSQNDIRETPAVFKQRTPLLPKTLPELSKSLLNGKIDIQKLNATISTSVSVSGSAPQTNNTSSEEKENKRVFSSQNGGGGLAVVRKGPKRKRARQRVSTTTGVPYVNNIESSTDAKYEIAASVLDIIKATTETERQASGYYSNYYDSSKTEKPSSSRVSNTWVENPSSKRQN